MALPAAALCSALEPHLALLRARPVCHAAELPLQISRLGFVPNTDAPCDTRGSDRSASAQPRTVNPQAVDVYALGVLLWEMYHGRRAWAGLTQLQVCP